jgi:hypothetical protein
MVQKSEKSNIVSYLEECGYAVEGENENLIGKPEVEVLFNKEKNSIDVFFTEENNNHLSVIQNLIDENYEKYSAKILDKNNTEFRVY